MSELRTRLLAEVAVPDTPLVDRAIEYARQKCEPYLFNDVMRFWLFAVRLGQIGGVAHDAEVRKTAPLPMNPTPYRLDGSAGTRVVSAK